MSNNDCADYERCFKCRKDVLPCLDCACKNEDILRVLRQCGVLTPRSQNTTPNNRTENAKVRLDNMEKQKMQNEKDIELLLQKLEETKSRVQTLLSENLSIVPLPPPKTIPTPTPNMLLIMRDEKERKHKEKKNALLAKAKKAEREPPKTTTLVRLPEQPQEHWNYPDKEHNTDKRPRKYKAKNTKIPDINLVKGGWKIGRKNSFRHRRRK